MWHFFWYISFTMRQFKLTSNQAEAQILRSVFLFHPASGLSHGDSVSGRGAFIPHISQQKRRERNLKILRKLGYSPHSFTSYYRQLFRRFYCFTGNTIKLAKKHKMTVSEYITYRRKKFEFANFKSKISSKYNNIIYRCTNPKDRKFKHYGGRGIRCFLTLVEFEFLWHRDYAAAMKQPSIDRIDSDGHYTIENCRFIEMSKNREAGKPYSRTPYHLSLRAKVKRYSRAA